MHKHFTRSGPFKKIKTYDHTAFYEDSTTHGRFSSINMPDEDHVEVLLG